MSASPNENALKLLVEEYFSGEDERFVETLRQIHSAPFLAAVADKWKKDPRPWARQQLLAYLQMPMDCAGHQPIYKRGFKYAEAQNDDEMMAAFLVAFDRSIQRIRAQRWAYDSETRQSYQEEYLVSPKDVMDLRRTQVFRDTKKDPGTIRSGWPGTRLFTHHTRYYMRRRAWRYFRRIGFKRAGAFPQAMARALAEYRDEDLAKGENILDSWGLVHACFGKHDALEFTATQIRLKTGRTLAELTPAPLFLTAWQGPGSAQILLRLIYEANSHLVRVWAMQLLCREHRDLSSSLEHLFHLFEHEDPSVQQFGAQILEGLSGLDKMPVTFWLRLLQTRNPEALQKICDIVTQRVSPERLDLPQCLALACHRATPVARIGLKFLQARTISTPQDRQALLALADALCSAVGKELAEWALKIVGHPDCYHHDAISRFFDSNLSEIRMAAWDWLVAGSPAYNDPVLWSRLTETPYDDLRLRLVDHLQKRVQTPAAPSAQLAPVWCSVLLGVHRGGRQKLKAVRQVGEAIERNPGQIEELLPVLAVAVRSVRRPEARAGLAAVVRAVEAQPDLAKQVRRFLPELELAEVPA